MYTETYTEKELPNLKKTITLYFDENDNCKYLVRKLNGVITSAQDNKGKWLTDYSLFLNN